VIEAEIMILHRQRFQVVSSLMLVCASLAACHPVPAPAQPSARPRGRTGARFAAAEVPSQFVIAGSSDAWVHASFEVQARFERLILVDGSATPARAAVVPPLDLDAREPAPAQGPARSADVVVATLQQAVDVSRGGDVIAVMPGEYQGFVMGKRPGVGPGKYIRMVALGAPGAVAITRAAPGDDARWMAWFRTAQYVIFEGFHLAGQSQPSEPAPDTPWAGVFLDGNFRESGEMAHHIALVRLLSHHHNRWGMHSTDTHTVLIQDSLFGFSGSQHGAYVSDGSDDYVIRRNVFIGNHQAGLQCNMDPIASFQELVAHPAMQHLAPIANHRAWVERALAAATKHFGAGNFPDGRGVNFLIEDNVINGNGKGGAAGLNFASMSHSLIQNNLLYGNHAHGIAQWDDANDFDEPFRSPDAQRVARFQGPSDLPMFGCQQNVVRHNTVLLAQPERAALQARNGSWGMLAYNNIAINDAGPSLEIFDTSFYRLEAAHNLVRSVDYTGQALGMRALAARLPEDAQTRTGYTRALLARHFVAPGEQPWAVLAGDWWQLNPQRPDFRPKSSSRLLSRGARRDQLLPRDLLGRWRTTPALGALAP
jgi:hypothetical protein